MEFRKPLSYVKLPCDSFTRISGKGLQMTLSEEHNVLYWNEPKSNPKTITWKEALKRHNKSKTKGWTGKIKTSFTGVNSQGVNLSEGDLRLQVAVMADGRIVKEGKDNYTQMRFAKKRKYDRLLRLCEEFNLPYKDNGSKSSTRYSSGKEYEVIVWPKLSDKTFTSMYYKCSSEQLYTIFDEVFHWDGSIVNNGKTFRYFSKHKGDCDFVQFVAASQGYNTSLVEDTREGKNSWTLNCQIRGRGFRSFANKDRKNLAEEVKSFDGFKYCFTTSTGYWVAREDGKVFLTGNSGKSHLLQMHPLKYVPEDTNFNGVFFRRVTTQLVGAGGLWPESQKLYAPFKIKTRTKPQLQHKFPNGGTLTFMHMQHEDNRLDHQGLQYSAVYFDELTHFTETQFTYLLSRLRSDAKSKSYCMASCNPDNASWVLNWIEWWLDKEGYPDPDKKGKLRYYVVVDDKPVFANTKEELKEKFPDQCRVWNPIDEEYVEIEPKSITFIGGTIFDNPILIKKNPNYLATLKSLPRVERARLLDGNWYVKPEGSGHFERSWLEEVETVPVKSVSCRAWDKAGSIPSETYRHPDFTASIKMSKDKEGIIYISGDYDANAKDQGSDIVGKFRRRAGDREKLIKQQAELDGKECTVILAKDAGQAGQTEFLESAKALMQEGHIVKADPMANNKSKVVKFSPFAAAAQNGLVKIVPSSFPNKATYEAYLTELESFTGERSTATIKDDWVDCTASGFNYIVSARVYKCVVRNQNQSETHAKKVIDELHSKK